MMRGTRIVALALAANWAAFGQSAGTPLRFEVASVKPVAPTPDGRYMIRMRVNAGELNYQSASLTAIIQAACEVRAFQVAGPDWMASTRFDVVARLPAGTPQSKVPEMLRSLLADRFKMTTHRETRELPEYALVVGKNGPKMKESEAGPIPPPPADPASNSGAGAADCGPTGKTAAASGWMINKGPGRLEGHAMNMPSLANTLAALLGRPVVDQTGLKGNYDFDLDYTPGEGPRMSPGEPAPPSSTGGGPPAASEIPIPSAGAPSPEAAPLLNAVQSQLGLKLEARRGPMQVIVVDHIERIPTEN